MVKPNEVSPDEAREYCKQYITAFAACMKVQGLLGPFYCRKELRAAKSCFREFRYKNTENIKRIPRKIENFLTRDLVYALCVDHQRILSMKSASILCLKLFLLQPCKQRALFQSTDDYFCDPVLQLCAPECCRITIANEINGKIEKSLKELLKISYFRYYKINLTRPCPFWKEDLICSSEGCSVAVLANVPSGWESQLSDIQFPTFHIAGGAFRAWDFDEDEFCLLDREGDSKGVYVDLQENPEQFTGYSGESSRKIWQSIYEENCFNGANSPNSLTERVWKKCLERQLFYRVISGLHASISVHLSYYFYDHIKKAWTRNRSAFMERVGNHPDRLKNIYLLFSLLYRAICRLAVDPNALCLDGLDSTESSHILTSLREIASYAVECPVSLDHALFSSSKPEVIEEFKEHFRNVTRIMDCVSCERCRLWGKIQTIGIGTALKVLSTDHGGHKLRRAEVICLINTLGRLSKSLSAIEEFFQISPQLHLKAILIRTFYLLHPVIIMVMVALVAVVITWFVISPKKAPKTRNK